MARESIIPREAPPSAPVSGGVSRRDFLLRGVAIASTVGLAAVAGARVFEGSQEEQRAPALEQSPEFNEAISNLHSHLSKVDFFTGKGHMPWVQNAVQHPLVNSIGRTLIEDMDTRPEAYSRVGDTLRRALEITASRLGIDIEQAYHNDHAVFAALIASAGVINHFVNFKTFGFTAEEITKRWGDPNSVAGQRWGEKGFGNRSFARVFPTEEHTGDKISGKDRSMHLIHHMLLTYTLLYSQKHNLPFKDTMPPPLALFIKLGSKDPETTAAELSFFTGIGYEVLSSTPQQFESVLRRSNQKTDEGIMDPDVGKDIFANTVGAYTGIAAMRGGLREVIEIFNDPDIETKTSDHLNTMVTTIRRLGEIRRKPNNS